MAVKVIARTLAGLTGNCLSLFLFLSPIPIFMKIYKEKNVSESKPDLFLATMFNCALWVSYGVPNVHRDNILVVPSNATGLAIELFYLAVFIWFSPNSGKVKVMLWIIWEIVFVGIIIICTLLIFHTHDERSSFVGVFLSIISVSRQAYFGIANTSKVIKTKTVKDISFSVSLATFLNGLAWIVYAFFRLDVYSLIANGAGTLSGAIQIIVYLGYYKNVEV